MSGPPAEPQLDAQQMETLLQSKDIGFAVDVARIAADWLIKNGFDKASLLDTRKWDEIDRTEFRKLEGINGGHMAKLNGFTPMKDVWRQGLRQLGRRTLSNSKSTTRGHAAADSHLHHFQTLSDIDFKKHTQSDLWNEDLCMDWSTEADIVDLVVKVIREIIASLGLARKLSCRRERGIFQEGRPDVWVITLDGVPILIFEVKVPSPTVMTDDLVKGQVFDYLMMLRTFYGIAHAFGILTTYNEWQVVWLPDTNHIANSKAIHSPGQHPVPESPQKKGATPTKKKKIRTKVLADESEINAVERRVYYSDTYKWDNDMLPWIIASVIRKADASPSRAVELVSKERRYISITSDTFLWAKLPVEQLNYANFPAKGTTRYYLLHRFESGGRDGRVYMACDKQGCVCVVKIFSLDTKQDAVDNEVNIWQKVWNLVTYSTILNLHPALIMPLLEAPTPRTPTINDATVEAINKLADAGLKHNDLKWDHVGIIHQGKKITSVLFDLTDCSELDEESKEAGIAHMCAVLNIEVKPVEEATHL
jgi:hypothetical protein